MFTRYVSTWKRRRIGTIVWQLSSKTSLTTSSKSVLKLTSSSKSWKGQLPWTLSIPVLAKSCPPKWSKSGRRLRRPKIRRSTSIACKISLWEIGWRIRRNSWKRRRCLLMGFTLSITSSWRLRIRPSMRRLRRGMRSWIGWDWRFSKLWLLCRTRAKNTNTMSIRTRRRKTSCPNRPANWSRLKRSCPRWRRRGTKSRKRIKSWSKRQVLCHRSRWRLSLTREPTSINAWLPRMKSLQPSTKISWRLSNRQEWQNKKCNMRCEKAFPFWLSKQQIETIKALQKSLNQTFRAKGSIWGNLSFFLRLASQNLKNIQN